MDFVEFFADVIRLIFSTFFRASVGAFVRYILGRLSVNFLDIFLGTVSTNIIDIVSGVPR